MKLKRYDMETLGGGHDYSWKEDEYGDWCRSDDVEKLEAERDALREVVDVVSENYGKGRLINAADAEDMMEKGNGYIIVPHEECIADIKEALAALDAQQPEAGEA